MAHQVVVVDQRLPRDHFILQGIDTAVGPQGETDPKRVPLFTVGELGKVFFARTAHWVRWLETGGKMLLDNEPIGDRRTKKGARVYTLGDVESIVHGLAQQGVISGAQMTNALIMVQTLARQWGYIS